MTISLGREWHCQDITSHEASHCDTGQAQLAEKSVTPAVTINTTYDWFTGVRVLMQPLAFGFLDWWTWATNYNLAAEANSAIILCDCGTSLNGSFRPIELIVQRKPCKRFSFPHPPIPWIRRHTAYVMSKCLAETAPSCLSVRDVSGLMNFTTRNLLIMARTLTYHFQ